MKNRYPKIRTVVLIVLVSFIIIIFNFSYYGYQWYISAWKDPSINESEMLIFIPSGSSLTKTAEILYQKKVLNNHKLFTLIGRLNSLSDKIQAGEYLFPIPVSPQQIYEMLSEGKVILHSVTIPEGLTKEQTASLIERECSYDAEQFLELAGDMINQIIDFTVLAEGNDSTELDVKENFIEDPEGYLFPDTYFFAYGAPIEQLISSIFTRFKEVFSKIWAERNSDLELLPQEVVILASLIQKETGQEYEMPLISSVFYKRLKKGMLLQCDPTVIYAISRQEALENMEKQKYLIKWNVRTKCLSLDDYPSEQTFQSGCSTQLKSEDLKYDSPYNTYLYPGLPPGPITNPGASALLAAVKPDLEADYLYFVAKGDGSHHFTESYNEHKLNVKKLKRFRSKKQNRK